MRKSLFCRFSTALLVSCMVTTLSASEKTLLVYGDSLSAGYGLKDINQGWVQLLQEKIDQQQYPWNVVNISISGETSAGGLSRLRDTLDATKPDLVLLELGANDGLQGIPLTSFKSNMEQMIALITEHDSDIILFEMQIPPNYGPVYTKRFTQVFAELSNQWDIPVVPFFLDGVAGNHLLNQSDGIHPTAQAQPRLLANVWPVLEPHLQMD